MAFADAQSGAVLLYGESPATITLGESCKCGDILGVSAGEWVRALATVGTAIQGRCVAGEDAQDGQTITVYFGIAMLRGSRFTGATVGGALYVAEGTDYGKYTQTAPTTTGDCNKIIGYAVNATTMVVEPSRAIDSVA